MNLKISKKIVQKILNTKILLAIILFLSWENFFNKALKADSFPEHLLNKTEGAYGPIPGAYPAFSLDIDTNITIANLHRKDSYIAKQVGGLANNPLSAFPTGQYAKMKNMTAGYIIYLPGTKYKGGKYDLEYSFYAFTEGKEFYRSQGLQRITLDCKSNKYFTRSNDFGGMREVQYGEKLDIENESTFGKWITQICNGESEIFKKVRRGNLKFNF